jgi:hypothetical protein
MQKRMLIFAGAAAMAAGVLLAQSQTLPAPLPNSQGELPKPQRIGARQPPPAVRVAIESKPAHRPAHDSKFESIVSKLDPAKLYPSTPGSREAQVAAVVRRSAANTIRLHLQDTDTPRLLTFATSDGDVLLARWGAAESGRPERATWLWDEPWWDIFVIEVDPAVLQSDQLTRYCEGLFVWDTGPIGLRSMSLTYLDSQPGKQVALGTGEYIQTSRGVYVMWLSALASGDHAYIGVTLSKSIILAGAYGEANIPSGAWEVKERFPPLRDRLSSWSRDALLEELGKGAPGNDYLRRYPRTHDVIILQELLSRGPLSDAEVRQVVVGDFDKGDAYSAEVIDLRVGTFLLVVESRNELAAYAPALRSVLLGTPILAAYEDPVMGRVATAMDKHGIDFSEAALLCLERGRYTRMSLFYLQFHARDEQTLRKLQSIPVRPDLEDTKRFAVKRIAERLGVPVSVQ